MKKLILIADIIQHAYFIWVLKQLLPKIILLSGLIITISMFISFSLISALNMLYLALLRNEFNPVITTLYIALTALIVIGVLVWYARIVMQKISISHNTSQPHEINPMFLSNIASAFISGLMAEQTRK